MTWRGLVETVETENPRGFVSVDVTAGVSTLPIVAGETFYVGCGVTVAGVTYTVTSLTISNDESATPSSLGITPTLAADVEGGEPVELVTDASTKWARVVLGDGIGDAVTATIPPESSAFMALADGNYEGDNRPLVDVDRVNGELVVQRIVGSPPVIDGSNIDPDTLPTPPLSDGNAPTSSPTPTTLGGLRQVFVKWDPVANADLVTYEVHVTATAGAPLPTPGAATRLASTAATLIAVSQLPDRTPFAYDTTYYFSTIASDADGSATASPWVAGAMDRAATGDLVAGSVTTEMLNSVLAILGSLKIGGDLIELSPPTSTSDGNGGLTLGGGIIIKDPDNLTGEPLVRLHPKGSTFRGKLVADIVTVLQDLIINGNASISGGSTLTFRNGVPDPTVGPAWASGAETAQVWPTVPTGYVHRGFQWYTTGSQWIELLENTATGRAYFRTVSTSGSAGTLTLLPRTVTGTPTNEDVVNGFAIVGGDLFFGWGFQTASVGMRYFLTKVTIATNTYQTQVAVAGGNPTQNDNLNFVGSASGNIALGGTGTAVDDYIAVYSTALNELRRASVEALPVVYAATVGPFDYGSEKVVATLPGGVVKVYTPDWTAQTLTEDTTKGWTGATGAYPQVWDGTKFYMLSSGFLRKWSSWAPGASDVVWSAVHEDLTTGGHTAPSPATTFQLPTRHVATLTLPPAPSGVVGADVWVGYAASGNAATKYKRAETLTGRTMVLSAGKQTTGTTTIPATSTAGGSPAKIKSEATGWEGSGDGTFKVKTATTGPEAVNKAQMDAAVAAVVIPDWGSWVDISSKYVAGPTSATMEIRRRGKDRMIRASLTWSWTTFQSRNIVAVAGIDAADRPSATTFAFAYMEGARPGSAFIRADGSIAVANMATDTRTTAQTTIVYTVD